MPSKQILYILIITFPFDDLGLQRYNVLRSIAVIRYDSSDKSKEFYDFLVNSPSDPPVRVKRSRHARTHFSRTVHLSEPTRPARLAVQHGVLVSRPSIRVHPLAKLSHLLVQAFQLFLEPLFLCHGTRLPALRTRSREARQRSRVYIQLH